MVEVRRLAKEMEEIRHINQTILQQENYNLNLRLKAEVVAEYFALWIQSAPPVNGQPANHSAKQLNNDEFKRLNELSFQCALWLPQGILNDLNNTIGNAPGS